MDALSDLLQVVKLNSALFLEARFTAPWCIESQSGHQDTGLFAGHEHIIFFHVVTAGRCNVRLSRGGEAMAFEAGDLILLPHDDAHLLGSDLQLAGVNSGGLVQPPASGGLFRIDHGGGGEETRVMCGFLACDPQLSRPLLDALPRMLRVPLGHGAAAHWLLDLARRGAQENLSPGPGSGTVLAKLAELLFVEGMRRHIEALPQGQTGWLAGLRDPQLSRAMALMHEQPAADWTVESIGEHIGLSRSALAQRFTEMIGLPPMAYLKRWRLNLAAAALKSSSGKVAALAARYGYESEAAFNRAFKQEFGLPPAAWRRTRAPGTVKTSR